MARKVQLKNKSGQKIYPLTSSANVMMSDKSGSLDGKLSELKDEIGQISLTIGEIIRRLERLEAGGGVGPGTGSRVVGDILYLADGIAHSAEGMLTFIGGAAYSEEKLTINR